MGVTLADQGLSPAPGALLDWLRAIHAVVTVEVPRLSEEVPDG